LLYTSAFINEALNSVCPYSRHRGRFRFVYRRECRAVADSKKVLVLLFGVGRWVSYCLLSITEWYDMLQWISDMDRCFRTIFARNRVGDVWNFECAVTLWVWLFENV